MATSEPSGAGGVRARETTTGGTANVLDFHADPTGTAFSTVAFGRALDSVRAGARLRIPAGAYKLDGPTPWSGGPLLVEGDGEATQLLRASSVPFRAFDIRGVGPYGNQGVTVRDLAIGTIAPPGSPAEEHVALHFEDCYRVHVSNVHVLPGTTRANKAVSFDHCTQVSVRECDLWAAVNALYITGGTAVVTVTASQLTTAHGTGLATASNIVIDGSGGTLQCTNVTTNSGDHGLLAVNGTAPNPGFIFINDLEVNNCHGDCVRLNTGSQFWANQLWLSNQGVNNAEGAYCGLWAGPDYTGWLQVAQATFQHCAGTGASVLGGKSFWITDSSFSGCCGHGPGYYDVFLGAAVQQVKISGCNFDVEPFNGGPQARAAICVSRGVRGVRTGMNHYASGYPAGPVIDPGGAIVDAGGNIGWP